MTKVVIADDQAVVRAGLRTILEANGIDVVGEAADGRAAIGTARALAPDVVLMDIRMPVMDGIDATRELLGELPSARVLILTTYGIDEYVYDALRAGASGFILKTESPERLVDAVRVVAAGDALLGPEITRRLIDRFIRTAPTVVPAAPELADLTPREREVLILIAHGLSNSEIGRSLHVSDGTVKTHVSRILTKLGLRDRVQAVVFAHEHDLVGSGRR